MVTTRDSTDIPKFKILKNTLPFTLRGTVKYVSATWLSNNANGDDL